MPPELRARLDRELDAHRCGHITRTRPTGGGCIAETLRLETSTGARFFLKWSGPGSVAGVFDAEADSLRRLATTRTLRVPEVIATVDVPSASDPHWLLLEWLEPGPATAATWERLGAGLAELHRTSHPHFGWHGDNFIGTLAQANRPTSSWAEFWAARRLRPQLALALARDAFGTAEVTRFEALIAALEDILAPAQDDGPSLLHGDLWTGNLHVLESGIPALIDPSSYFGHREVDLAMTQLFGGFDARFLHAYREAWPLAEGFDLRCPVYQLYYLLVHVNLFGSSYRRPTLEALRTAGF